MYIVIETDESKIVRTWNRTPKGAKRVPLAFESNFTRFFQNGNKTLFTKTNGGAWTKPVLQVPASAQTALYNKLRDKAYTTLQLGADIGEGKQTLELVGSLIKAARSPLRTIGEFMRRAAKNRGKKDVLNMAMKDSAQALLAFRYGVEPLMQTIHDSLDIIRDPFPKVKVRAAKRWSVGDSIYSANSWPTGPNAFLETTQRQGTLSGGFVLRVNNPNLHAAEQMGLLNPALIAWELVPFSFVFDWFLPVGTYIGSLSDYAGCTLLDHWTTNFQVATVERRQRSSGVMYTCYDGKYYTKRTLDKPSLPNFLANLKLSQSGVHVQNAIALIVASKNRLIR